VDTQLTKGGNMDESDLVRLREAVQLLENPSWTARLTDLIGIPIEWGMSKLPDRAVLIISKATTKAMNTALKAAVATMKQDHSGRPKRWWHRGAVVVSGGIGGFFSLPGLSIELPITTVIMLRSIADIARSEGERISSVDAELACIEVFALGGRNKSDDASETGYYAIRIALAKAISEAAQFIAQKGLIEEGAPVIARLVAKVAARFETVVTEKIAGEAVPVLGAVGGATINLLFISHFQSMAKGHFIVRSLERKYGEEVVKKEYEGIAAQITKG
jgi:hypothetical protein